MRRTIDPLWTVRDAAKVLSVNPDTVHRWFREGILTKRTLPYGGARVLESELREIGEGKRATTKRVPAEKRAKLALVR